MVATFEQTDTEIEMASTDGGNYRMHTRRTGNSREMQGCRATVE